MAVRSVRGTTGDPVRVQGSHTDRPDVSPQLPTWRQAGLGLACLLSGCSSLSSVNPVNWWHDLEGGAIAEQRPPPPNADAGYRNLGDAPTGVPTPDAALRGQVADALVSDRANAQYDASLAPLSAPASAPLRPKTVPTPPSASAESSSASLAAAAAPPPPPVPSPPRPVARAAPAAPVQSAPLSPPAAVTPAVPPPAAAPAATEQPAAELPSVPTQPPAAPQLSGVPAVTAPTPPPPTPKPVPPPPAALVIGAPVTVAFAAGSAALPSSAIPGLKLLARTRGAGLIGITGYGEAKSATPEAQQAAMPLAMARVRAVAAYLLESGVPSSALRIDGEAQGTGVVARTLK